MNFKNSRFPKKPLELLSVQEMDELSAVDNEDERQEVEDDDILPILDVSSSLPNRAKKITARQLVEKFSLSGDFADKTLSNLSDYEEAIENLGGPFAKEGDLSDIEIIFSSRSELEGTSIPAETTSIIITGMSLQGDMKPKFYYKGSQSSLAIQSADGAYWNPEPPVLRKYRVEDFADDPSQLEGLNNANNFVSSLQGAIDFIVSNGGRGSIQLPPGDFWINDEIDCTGFSGQGSIEVSGSGKSTRIYILAFGSSKAIFRFSNSQAPYISFHDFQILGDGIRDNKNSPSVFHIPAWSRGSRWFNMSIWRIGNIVAWSDLIGNVDCDNLEIQECGWQPVEKNVPSSVRVSISSGTTTLTSNEPVFDSNDVGKTIFIDSAGGQPGNISGALPVKTTIQSYTSPTEVEVTDAPPSSATNRYLSFDFIRGTIVNLSRNLVLSGPCLDQSDVGRPVFIDIGSSDGTIHSTRIESVQSATECTIVDQVTRGASNTPVFFTPNIAIGRTAAGNTNPTGNIVNDISFDHLQMENFRGPGLILSGRMCFFDHLKCHAISPRTENNFARSMVSLICNGGSSYFVNSAQLEFGGYHYAPVWLRGGTSGFFLTNFSYTTPVRDSSLIDWAALGDSGTIAYGPGRIGTRLDIVPTIVNTRIIGTTTSLSGLKSRAWQVGPVMGTTPSSNHLRTGKTIVGRISSTPEFIQIEDDSSFTIDMDELIDTERFGFFSFWTDAGPYWGKYFFNITSSHSRSLIAEGASTINTQQERTVVTSDDEAVTVSFQPGYIRIINRSGDTRTLRWLIEA